MEGILTTLGTVGATVALIGGCAAFFALGLLVMRRVGGGRRLPVAAPVVPPRREQEFDPARPPQLAAEVFQGHNTRMCSYTGMPSGCSLYGMAAGTPIWRVSYWKRPSDWVSYSFFERTPEGEATLKKFYQDKFGLTLELVREEVAY